MMGKTRRKENRKERMRMSLKMKKANTKKAMNLKA
jgi:hypothetical protein